MVKGTPLFDGLGSCRMRRRLIRRHRGPECDESAKAPESGRPDLIKINTLAVFGKAGAAAGHVLPRQAHRRAAQREEELRDLPRRQGRQAVPGLQAPGGGEARAAQRHLPCQLHRLPRRHRSGGKTTGPLDGFCRSCHNAEAPVAAWLDAGLDKVLHYRHVASNNIPPTPVDNDNCGVCHHEHDKKTKKTFYAKGKEDSCRACHGDKPQNGVMSLEQAAHQQCVLCHFDLAQKGVKENGPYVCAGCHGAAGLAQVAKKNQAVVAKLPNQEVPRLQRGQPDAALITYNPKVEGGQDAKPLLMNPVAFDHKAHEKYNNSCRVCHHAGIESCDKCHTLAGSKKGKFVTFEQAMHHQSSQQSCIGCHAARQAAANCAGCHNPIRRPSGRTTPPASSATPSCLKASRRCARA